MILNVSEDILCSVHDTEGRDAKSNNLEKVSIEALVGL